MLELLLCLLVQLLAYALLGEWTVRLLAGFSPWRARLPEAALLAGLPCYALIGYAALPFARTGRAILVAVLVVLSSLWFAAGKPPTSQRGELWIPYQRWRSTPWFRLALALVLLMACLIAAARLPWQFGLESAGKVIAGTPVWDDLRTLGGPLSLAAHGYPLRSPIAVEMGWPYPAGSFIYAASLIAWAPAQALPVLVADTVVQVLFYGLAVLVLAPSFASGLGSFLLCGTALISASFNLWHLGLNPDWWWVQYFYGFYRSSGQVQTAAWNPYGGLLWISNHAIGFAAAVLASRWVSLSWVLVLFAAATSMDMTAMALVTAGLILAWQLFRRVWWKQSLPPWFWPVAARAAAAFAVLILIHLATLQGEVDSPFDPPFPWNSALRYNLGLLACGVGPYVALVLVAWRMHRARPQADNQLFPGAGIWLTAIGVGLAFSLLFEYHSIWFWRFSLASHLLFGIVCAVAFNQLRVGRQRTILAWLWGLMLLAGAVETSTGVWTFWKYAARRPREEAHAMRWVAQNVPLSARVAEILEDKRTVAPSVDLLRTGNRGGASVYDRSHALVGYREYEKKFRDLAAALAGNDFLMVRRSAKVYSQLLEDCRAEPAFKNQRVAVWRLTETCRQWLATAPAQSKLLETYRPAWNPATPAEQLPAELLLFAVEANPERVFLLRRRLEELWAARNWSRAEQLAEKMVELRPDLAEARYCLAFTLQAQGKRPEAVVENYTHAMRLGYSEFWVRYNRGAAYFSQKNYLQAFEDLSRARELDPRHAGAQQLFTEIARMLDRRSPSQKWKQ
ncbi:MAG: hypothetical protein NZV14_05950 [Bryobacteraceae bacterium]|nr:hypothetical protein [Bryobacteraceae bacterium]MDW8377683.1 hypothetical protein [Bryobacterales bacterium]